MTSSEIILKNFGKLQEKMVDLYRSVLNCSGDIQYTLYVWEDGEIRYLEGVQGDNSRLYANDSETHKLVYVDTIQHPFFNVWDNVPGGKPDDPAEAERERQETIDWLVDGYEETVSDRLDVIIQEYKYDDD